MFSTTSYSETVCLLSKLKSTYYIDVDLDLSELDVTQAEAKATYDDPIGYVELVTGGNPQAYLKAIGNYHGLNVLG